MSKFTVLQEKHVALLNRYETDKQSQELREDVQKFIEETCLGGREIPNTRERNQLRANLRFWGTFIYDAIGTYPNINLLPSEKEVITDEKPPTKLRWGVGIAGVLALIFVLFVYMIMKQFAATAATEQFVAAAQTETTIAIQQTQEAWLFTPTLAPTETLTVFFPPTEKPFVFTETPVILSIAEPLIVVVEPPLLSQSLPTPTPPSLGTPTPEGFPTATAEIPAPMTGDFDPKMEYKEWNCDKRLLTISIITENDAGLASLENVQVIISRSSSAEAVINKVVSPQELPLELILGNPAENDTYLLQIIDPQERIRFRPTILQYSSNCTRNNTAVVVRGDLLEEGNIFKTPELSLLAWGGNYDGQSWIAKLGFRKEGVYWLADGAGNFSLLQSEFIIKGNYCDFGKATLLETTGGTRSEVTLVLYSPMSFCPPE